MPSNRRQQPKHQGAKGRHFEERSADQTPGEVLTIGGWHLLMWSGFRDRWRAMLTRVRALRAADPEGYVNHPDVVFFAMVRRLIADDIPRDPSGTQFRQRTTLGEDYVHWRRAKFGGRFRLFFRYHSPSKAIIYAWLNDDKALRKAGSKTDVYNVFRAMLERGVPPTDWDALLAEAETDPLPPIHDLG